MFCQHVTSMDFSYGPKGEVFDNLHLYGEMYDHESHKMMSVDDLTYQLYSVMRFLIGGNGILMEAWKPVML